MTHIDFSASPKTTLPNIRLSSKIDFNADGPLDFALLEPIFRTKVTESKPKIVELGGKKDKGFQLF